MLILRTVFRLKSRFNYAEKLELQCKSVRWFEETVKRRALCENLFMIKKKTGRRCRERGTHKLPDRQRDTHKHRQRSHSQSCHSVLRQTGGKMLYFPSKLKCQLTLMWKWRLSGAQHADTQIRKQHLPSCAQTQIQNLESWLVNYSPPMVSCTQVTKECACGCVCMCVCMRLCKALIRPSVTAHSICHMKVISEWRCNCGVLYNKKEAK